MLAPRVLLSHVDHAAQIEARRRGRGGDAVLAGARLGDDGGRSHAPGEQALADGVVDLVSAGVEQVFALEEHATACPLREAGRLDEWRRPAGEISQRDAQLLFEDRILARAPILAL